jgi:hypothetical protein
MSLQLQAGFSTEGNQYAKDSSYYLLDTVPGSGSNIAGPITVTGNLVVTGTETVQGAQSVGGAQTVAGPITAPSLSAPTGQVTPLTLTGSLAGTTLTSPAGAIGPVIVSHPVGASITLTQADNISVASTAGNVSMTSTTGQVSMAVGGANHLVSVAGAQVVSGGGSLFMLNAQPPSITPSLFCPSFRNPFISQSSSVTRTGASVLNQGLFQLPIQNVGSAQVAIPVTPLYANNCVPQLFKIVITNLGFEPFIGGSCSPSNPFTLFFIQGSASTYNEIATKSLASFVYTNQNGAFTNTPTGAYNVASVTLPFINAGQVDPAGGPINVWYYSGFTGFFNSTNSGMVQSTFTLSPVL